MSKKCKGCGKKFSSKYNNWIDSDFDLYEEYCLECTKKKQDEVFHPVCRSCGRNCRIATDCAYCGKPCCNKCGKIYPYYSSEAYVCSNGCYNKLVKNRMDEENALRGL